MKDDRKKAPKTKNTTTVAEAAGHGWSKHLATAVFLSLSVFVAYAVSLKGTWALDDTWIGQSTSIENSLNLHLGYRKVAHLSFVINKWIDPFNPLNYRVTNIIIHVFNSFLVYLVALKTLRLPDWREKYGDYSNAVALLSSVVFALHPININAVAYIVQRMASLATMFVLLALLSYISARTSEDKVRSKLFYALTGISIFLGVFSKENAVMAIPLILLCELVFLSGPDRGILKRAAVAATVGLFILGAASVFLKFHKSACAILGSVMKPTHQIPQSVLTSVDVYWTPIQHVLTELRVVARYLFLLVLPLPRFLVFDWWGFPVSTSIMEPASTAISLLLVLGLVAFSFWKRRELPFFCFGILWYLIAISLESFIAVGSDLYFEHRNYLPLTGLVVGVTAEVVSVLKGPTRGKTLWALVCILSLLLGGLTFQRNLVWRDSVTLWKDTVDKTDGNLRAIIALGNSFLRISDLTTAKKYYGEAVKTSLSRHSAQYFEASIYSLGMVNLFMGNLVEAKKVIDIMDKRIEGSDRQNILKAFYSSMSGDPGEAIKRYEIILPSVSGMDRVIVFTLLGDAYSRQGSREKAIENYKNALMLDPSFPSAYYGLGSVYLGMKDLKRASFFIEKTLALDPQNALALSDMADILLIKKEPLEKAREFAARAVANSPVFYQPYLTMGNVLTVMGREDAAEDYFRKAKEHGVNDYMIPFSKARAYFMKGDKEKVKINLEEVLSSKDTPENVKKTISESLSKM
jgi:hypothetical protein